MKKHAFRIGLVVTMLLGLMMISANAAAGPACPHGSGAAHGEDWTAVSADEVAAWGGTTLASGKYYLTESASVDAAIVINSDVSICLNGNNITFTHAYSKSDIVKCFDVQSAADDAAFTFEIFDCKDSGHIYGTAGSSSYTKRLYFIDTKAKNATINWWGGTLSKFYGEYGAIRLNVSSVTFNMYGGSFNANASMYGAVICVQFGEFNMYDGATITSCSVGNAGAGGGGAVSIGTNSSSGTFNMYGGTISNSKSGKVNSSAIRLQTSKAKFNMYDGTIEVTNTAIPDAISNLGTVTISGGSISSASGNAIAGSGTFNITGGTFSQDVTNYIDTDKYEVIQGTVWDKNDPNKPVVDYGTTLEGHEGLWFELKDGVEIEDGKQYYLKENVTLADTLTVAVNATICLHDHTLTSAASDDAIIVNESKSLTIQDCGTNGTITTSAADARAFNVTGTLNIKGGTITGFTTSGNGGAVLLNSYGDLNLSAGTISYNKAKNGGAIAYTASGSGSKNNIVITGGAIDHNTATTQGGAIYGAGSAYALIDMSAGALSNNKAKEGGAVKMGKGATFNLKGGEIFGNEGSGAAAYIYYGGTMNVSGGYIYSNHPKATTSNNGNAPAIYVAFTPSKLNVTGGNFGIDPEGNPAPNYYKQTDGASGLAYGSVVYSMNTEKGANFVASEISGGNFYVEGNQYPFYDGRRGTADNVVTGGNINSLFRVPYVIEETGNVDTSSVCIADGYMAYEASNIGVKNMKYTFAPKFNIESTSVELKDSLNLNFILDTAELPAAAKDFEVSFSDGTTGKLVVDGDKCYAAYTGIAAKDMAKEISVTITNNGNEICKLENESVKAYADRALAAESTLTEAEKTAVADMLHYGAAAQTYFGVEGAKVNEGVTGGSAADVTIAAGTVAAEAAGKYVGSSVSLKNEIVLNMYFDKSVETVTVNGEAVELVESGNYKVATITGIKLPEAKTALNVVVDGVAFSDSIEAYAFRAQHLGEADADLAALCQKMMNLVASVGELN